MGKALATCNIALAIGACIGYVIARDWKQATYWGSAAVLTFSVTYMG